MSGVCKVRTVVNITGLGDEITMDSGEVTMTVPVETHKGYTVVETAQTTAIQLFAMIDHIVLAKIYGVYIKSEAGTIYIVVDTAATTTIAAADADLVLKEGEAVWLPIKPVGNLE